MTTPPFTVFHLEVRIDGEQNIHLSFDCEAERQGVVEWIAHQPRLVIVGTDEDLTASAEASIWFLTERLRQLTVPQLEQALDDRIDEARRIFGAGPF
jgi:hypothetical protein